MTKQSEYIVWGAWEWGWMDDTGKENAGQSLRNTSIPIRDTDQLMSGLADWENYIALD